MSDTATIVAFVSSGAIGVTSVAVNVYGAAAWRRRQGREERVAELRNVLDVAAESVAKAMWAIGAAHAELSFDYGTATEEAVEAGEAAVTRARAMASDARGALLQIWAASRRISLRRGSNAQVSRAIDQVECAIGPLVVLVERNLVDPMVAGYDEAWQRARAAELAFYDAAAQKLREAEGRPWPLRHRKLARPPAQE